MKLPTYLILISALAGVGCSVPNDSSIRFLNAHEFTLGPQTSGCSPQNIAIYRGSLDLSGNTRYIVAFDWENLTAQINTTISGDPLAGPARNDFVLNHVVFNYASMPNIGFQSEQLNAFAVQVAGAGVGATGSNWLGLSLITPQARQALLDRVQVGDSYELQATFQAFGELASGEKISSNKVTYPILIYRSGFSGCRTAGDIRAPTGPCGDFGGQDGTQVACCRDITPRPAGCPQ